MDKRMLAKDFMRRRVVTLAPDATLREAARVLGRHAISGAPVVSRSGEVLGVISLADLVWLENEPQRRVEQAMTPWAVSFEEDVPVAEIARQMLAKRIHRVVVTRDGRLTGILTTMDMLRALLALDARRGKGD